MVNLWPSVAFGITLELEYGLFVAVGDGVCDQLMLSVLGNVALVVLGLIVESD